MRVLIVGLLVLLSMSCSGSQAVNNLYNQYKEDPGVTAVRVPKFMYGLLAGASPKMASFVDHTSDIRYMSIPTSSPQQLQSLSTRLNGIMGSQFTEVYRNNDESGQNVLSVRERKDRIKEILIFNTKNDRASFFYMKGDYDSRKIQELTSDQDIDQLLQGAENHLN